MNKLLIALFVSIFSLPLDNPQTTTYGVNLPETIAFNKVIRNYVGSGVREEFFVRAYVLGLYMVEKSSIPEEVINNDEAMSIRLTMTSTLLTSELMVKKIKEGFKKSLNGDIESIEKLIEVFCSIFSYEPSKFGDVYDIHYTPGIGIVSLKNGQPIRYDYDFLKIATKNTNLTDAELRKVIATLKRWPDRSYSIPSLEFKKAIFGIWFSEKPVDEVLKFDVLNIKD